MLSRNMCSLMWLLSDSSSCVGMDVAQSSLICGCCAMLQLRRQCETSGQGNDMRLTAQLEGLLHTIIRAGVQQRTEEHARPEDDRLGETSCLSFPLSIRDICSFLCVFSTDVETFHERVREVLSAGLHSEYLSLTFSTIILCFLGAFSSRRFIRSVYHAFPVSVSTHPPPSFSGSIQIR